MEGYICLIHESRVECDIVGGWEYLCEGKCIYYFKKFSIFSFGFVVQCVNIEILYKMIKSSRNRHLLDIARMNYGTAFFL
jgi:hypothetical protein